MRLGCFKISLAGIFPNYFAVLECVIRRAYADLVTLASIVAVTVVISTWAEVCH